MFGLFKRTKFQNCEKVLLINVINKLPQDFTVLINQINDGLIRGVLVDISDIPGYVAFTYDSEVIGKYDKVGERDYKLTNIKVYNYKESKFIPYVIFVSSGTVSGYSLEGYKCKDIDIKRIDVSKFIQLYTDNFDFKRISHLLNQEERKLISESSVYSVIIDKKEYFHLKDLEDGDFIGIDNNKEVYTISHDPQNVIRMKNKLSEILSIK